MEWTKRMISNGISTYCSDHITIKGLTLDVGDDCVSFKPNSTNIVVEDTICGGSHGVSVGALLNTPVSTISLRTFTSFIDRSDGTHTENGVRIKTWPGGKYGYGKGVQRDLSGYQDLQCRFTHCRGHLSLQL